MRANIPRNPPRPPVGELDGIYLQSMQEVSVRLMEALPAGEELWRTLGQVETMLLEAQLQGVHPSELFGNGGVAAFCQSILDEYRQEGGETVPAFKDPTLKKRGNQQARRDSPAYRRSRRMTLMTAVVMAVLLSALGLWFTGVISYWTGGASYYLEELHNFRSETSVVGNEPMEINLPLEIVSGMNRTVYADGEGFDIALTALETYEHAGSFTDPDTGETVYQKMRSWYLRLTYAVDSDFNSVTYVEPSSQGTVTVTLRDGRVFEGELTWIESGGTEGDREYARISVIDLPTTMDTAGATLRVSFQPPVKVEWRRIGVGLR